MVKMTVMVEMRLSKKESQMKVNPQSQSTAFSHLLVTSQLLVHESQE
jgi:hypothetical protein